MKNSILLPKAIYSTLAGTTAITDLVGSRIFPIVADFGTDFPYIAFSAGNITPYYSKDGSYEDDAVVEFVVAGDDYYNVLTIANEVRRAFEGVTISLEEFDVTEAMLTAVSEAYDDQAQCFIKRLSFTFSVE